MSARGLKLYSAHLVKHPHDYQPVLVTGGQLPMIGVPVDHHDRACGSERRTLEKGTSSQKVGYLCTGFASCLSDPREFGSSTSYHFAGLPAFVTIFLQVSHNLMCRETRTRWPHLCDRAIELQYLQQTIVATASNPTLYSPKETMTSEGRTRKSARVNTRSTSQE